MQAVSATGFLRPSACLEPSLLKPAATAALQLPLPCSLLRVAACCFAVDVIKSAGYKISALEIERILLEHAAVEEVAVVGVSDEAFGQRVGAIVVPTAAARKTGTPAASGTSSASAEGADQHADAERELLETLRADCADRLAAYKLPTALRAVSAIPKNAMGKINKKTLVKLFEARGEGGDV